MLYTMCAIVRQRLEQEKNPERRETILNLLSLLESPQTIQSTPHSIAR